jgi:hypothetical protein
MFNTHQEELYDIFGSHHKTQPRFINVSQSGYKSSLHSYRNVQCEYNISPNELINYLTKHDNRAVVLILDIGNDFDNTQLRDRDVRCAIMINAPGYLMNHVYKIIYTPNFKMGNNNLTGFHIGSGINYDDDDYRKYDYGTSIKRDRESYKHLIDNYENPLIFCDHYTTYNIFLQRTTCRRLIPNYAKSKTIQNFEEVINILSSDIILTPILNVFITYIWQQFVTKDPLGPVMKPTITALDEGDFEDMVASYDETLRDMRNSNINEIWNQIDSFP